jgi:hypothetical protein
MPNLTSTLVLLALVALPACATPTLSADKLYGSWRVAEVICQACGGPVLSLKNKVIEIDKNRVVNPSGDNCQGSPGLDLVKEMQSTQVLAGVGTSWPKPVRDAVADHTRIFYGFITCGDINYMQIALVSSDAAFYFMEGDIALALTRVK